MTKIHGRYTVKEQSTLGDFFDEDIPGESQVKTEWKEMPEFKQDDIDSFATIMVRVVDADALEKLAKLLGQPLTRKTKTVWFPRQNILPERTMFYVDEGDVK